MFVAAAVVATSGIYFVTAGAGSTPAAKTRSAVDPLPPVASVLKSVGGTVGGLLGGPGDNPSTGPSSQPQPQPSQSHAPAPAPQPQPNPPSDPGTGTGGNTGPGGCGMTVKLVPTCSGALWGMALPVNQVSSLEQKVSRPLTVVKEYEDFTSAFPSASEQQLMDSGHVLHFAWTAKLWSNQNATPSWKDIAAGKDDASVIIPEAKRLAAVKTPFFLDWDHEMDGKTRASWGTPADYVAAYRHIHAVFDQYGVDKAVWAWVPTGWKGNFNKVGAYYPGNDVVDWIGWDPYNGTVNGWQTPQQTFQSFYDFVTTVASAPEPHPSRRCSASTARSPIPTTPAAGLSGSSRCRTPSRRCRSCEPSSTGTRTSSL